MFLDVAFSNRKPRFIQEKRSYYEHCRLVPQVVIEHDENKINELDQCLKEKWDHIILLPICFHGQLIKWRSLCMQQLWFTNSLCITWRCMLHFPQTRKNIQHVISLRILETGSLCSLYDGSTIGSVIVCWWIYWGT